MGFVFLLARLDRAWYVSPPWGQQAPNAAAIWGNVKGSALLCLMVYQLPLVCAAGADERQLMLHKEVKKRRSNCKSGRSDACVAGRC